MVEENARRARWEAEAKQVIQRISKKCPGCKTDTEKNGKTCRKTCRNSFPYWSKNLTLLKINDLYPYVQLVEIPSFDKESALGRMAHPYRCGPVSIPRLGVICAGP